MEAVCKFSLLSALQWLIRYCDQFVCFGLYSLRIDLSYNYYIIFVLHNIIKLKAYIQRVQRVHTNFAQSNLNMHFNTMEYLSYKLCPSIVCTGAFTNNGCMRQSLKMFNGLCGLRINKIKIYS